jgi:predicted DNA-binding transcriptional regulator YafY
MRRAERLFSIVLELRRRPVTTAAQLADHLEVSARTVYRDIADLVASGIPIEGEAGVGYRLHSSFELPPLMFTVAEVQALVLGARMVEAWGDPGLRSAARNSLRKIEAVLPPSERHRVVDTALFALSFWMPEEPREMLGVVRRAIDSRRLLHISYARDDGPVTARVIRPLGLFFWGRTWTVAAWCELRTDHRSFRIDRIVDAQLLDHEFVLEPPVTLDDFRATIDRERTDQ